MVRGKYQGAEWHYKTSENVFWMVCVETHCGSLQRGLLTTQGLLGGLTSEGTGDRQGSARRGWETEEHEQHYEYAEQPYVWEAVPKGVRQVDVTSGQSEGLSVVLH
jgi:hypothetical protein